MPSTDTVDAITHDHADLQRSLSDRVDAVVAAGRTGVPFDEPVAELRGPLWHGIVSPRLAERLADVSHAEAIRHVPSLRRLTHSSPRLARDGCTHGPDLDPCPDG